MQQALRRSWLCLGDNLLFCRQTTLFDNREKQALRHRIVDVRVGFHLPGWAPASVRQTVMDSGAATWELQIHLDAGERIGMLDGLPANQLQWLATVLRRELEID